MRTPIDRISSLIILISIVFASFNQLHTLAQQPESRKTIIDQPFNDPKSYRNLTLPNRIHAILVKDPETNQSAAALQVGVGSLAEPLEISGLAHFCEHMLFLGSKKYPEIGSYNAFLSSHGGSFNAYTSRDATNYYFQVDPNYFQTALDMFSHFFIDPLFNQSAVDDEVYAVNSEFEGKAQEGGRRQLDLTHVLSNKDHIYSHFTIGNLQSLVNGARDSNISLVDALKKFYNQYYSSNIMTLAIVSNHSLDTMESWAKELFSSISDKNVTVPNYSNSGDPFTQRKMTYTQFAPVDDKNIISLLFPYVSVREYYHEKPWSYVSYFLRQDGPGSLSKYLLDKEYVTNLAADVMVDATFGSVFKVEATLTQEGIKDPDLFLTSFYSYINLMRKENVNKKTWNEISRLAALRFNYSDQKASSQMSLASTLASNLALYELSDVLSGDYLLKEYNETLLNNFLDAVNVNNSLVILSSPHYKVASNFKNDTDTHVETSKLSHSSQKIFVKSSSSLLFSKPSQSMSNNLAKASRVSTNYIKNQTIDLYNSIYKIKYTTHKIPAEFLRILTNISPAAFPELYLPDPNPYIPIPQSLKMICSNTSETACQEAYQKDAFVTLPTRVEGDVQSGRTWYQMDRSYRSPSYVVHAFLRTPTSYKTARDVFELQLYCNALQTYFKSNQDQQRTAGYGSNVDCGIDNMRIRFSGYSDKLDEIVNNVTQTIASKVFSKKVFEYEKKKLIILLNDTKSIRLNSKTIDITLNLLVEYNYRAETLVEAGQNLTYTDWKNKRSFDSYYYLENVIVGNIEQKKAENISKTIRKNLKLKDVDPDALLHNKAIDLTGKNWVYREFSPFIDSKDNCIVNYYQDGLIDDYQYAKLQLLVSMMRDSAFTYLRTNQSLGYVVSTLLFRSANSLGFGILVQGSEKTPNEVNAIIETFLGIFEENLLNISEATFREERDTLVNRLLIPPTSANVRVDNYISRILDFSYEFNLTQNVAKIISGFEKSNIVDYYAKLTRISVKKLSIQMYYKENENSTLPKEVLSKNQTHSGFGEELILDIEAYKKQKRIEEYSAEHI